MRADYLTKLIKDIATDKMYTRDLRKAYSTCTFHPALKTLMLNSRALTFPELLPVTPFLSTKSIFHSGGYFKSEKQ